MCLLPRRNNGQRKLIQVFKICLPKDIGIGFLFQGKHLSIDCIRSYIDTSSLCANMLSILDILSVNDTRNIGNSTFTERVRWHLPKFSLFLRKLYRTAASPHWFLSTFGQDDVTFTLVAATYCFYNHLCTIETLQHLVSIFHVGHTQILTDITTLHDLGQVYSTCTSLPDVPTFSHYVQKKLNVDTCENVHIDNTINNIRGNLLLSNKDIVQFIYLAFHECFNRTTFEYFTTKTSPSEIHNYSSPILYQSLHSEFTTKMTSYYTRDNYITTHINSSIINIPRETINGYSFSTPMLKLWIGQASDLQHLMDNLREDFPFSGITSGLKELLHVAALSDETHNAKEAIFENNPICPVYRCEFNNKTYFAMISSDNIETFWSNEIVLPPEDLWDRLSDEDLTKAIAYTFSLTPKKTVIEQLLLSRHEYINPHLPIYNIIFDFDLPLTKQGICFSDIHMLCCHIRQDILCILSVLLGFDLSADYPVYFFKSECDTTEPSETTVTYCTCSKKLGLRIICPLPEGYIIVGNGPLIALARILNRTIRLNRELVTLFPGLKGNDRVFDTGIYSPGRCVRIPHTCKISENGCFFRLLKLFVCHPGNKRDYLKGAFNLRNLLYHGDLTNPHECLSAILDICDTNEDFLTSKTNQHLPHKVLTFQDLERQLTTPILTWAENTIWPLFCDQLLKYLPIKHSHEFENVSMSLSTSNIIHVKPRRGSGFSCLTHQHRNRSQSVRLFITIGRVSTRTLSATLMSQCFANKCNNNKPVTHCSVHISI